MTASGDLNRRLLLQAPAETDDGQGGVTRTYETVTTLWAQVVPLTAMIVLTAYFGGRSLEKVARILARK